MFKVTCDYIGKKLVADDFFYFFLKFALVFAGSCFTGYVTGILCAWILKKIDFGNHKVVIMTLFVSSVYIPFLLAGLCSWSINLFTITNFFN